MPRVDDNALDSTWDSGRPVRLADESAWDTDDRRGREHLQPSTKTVIPVSPQGCHELDWNMSRDLSLTMYQSSYRTRNIHRLKAGRMLINPSIRHSRPSQDLLVYLLPPSTFQSSFSLLRMTRRRHHLYLPGLLIHQSMSRSSLRHIILHYNEYYLLLRSCPLILQVIRKFLEKKPTVDAYLVCLRALVTV